MTTLRKSLGRLKFHLVDRIPYLALEARGERMRGELERHLDELPAVGPPAGARTVDVHMFCGRKHLDMGIWASWSLLRHLGNGQLHVHSDGSLGEADLDRWRRVVPDLAATTREQRAERAADRLAERFPLLHEWRDKQIYSTKFLDFHLFGDGDRVVSLDSDVLCFRRPDELIEALEAPRPAMRWHHDTGSSYAAPVEVLEAATGQTVPRRVNTGFLCAKRWDDEDLAFFEEMLARLGDHGVPVHHHWAEQTLYALAAGRHPDAAALPEHYSVRFGRTDPRAAIRHYVGVIKVRPRFFTEGVPILCEQLSAAGASVSSMSGEPVLAGSRS